MESGLNGWTAEVRHASPTPAAPAGSRPPATFDYEQYYLAEWRNFDGYDKGLKTPYVTNYKVGSEWNVSAGPRTTHRVC